MKRSLLTILIMTIGAILSCSANGTSGTSTGPISGKEQIVSYGIGYSIGQSIMQQSIDGLDLDTVSRGIKDAYKGSEPAVPENEIKDALTSLRMEQMAKREGQVDANLQAAEKFLEENAKKEGIKKLDRGLQYEVINSGEGKSPSMDSEVVLHYRGTTIDGKEFDSSYKRGEPATMSPSGVIPGFSKALLKMKEGDKWRVFIHPDLAYGVNSPPGIEPNSLLIFELEVVEVK
ncbi:FKBP-type peptidyl-prolyl cis-trans isomerase N-terminal domain-containing protein [Nitrospirota bacterium]